MSFDQSEVLAFLYKFSRLTQRDTRVEQDTLGSVQVPLDRLYGAYTMRSALNLPIGHIEECMPRSLIIAMGIIKKAAVLVNRNFGLDGDICDAIDAAANDVITGHLYDEGQFPLSIWQDGAGSHTHMNVNEVISNRAIVLLKGIPGSKEPVHPVDHVSMSQDETDCYSSATNIAAAMQLQQKLFPALRSVVSALEEKEQMWKSVIKIGRTHLMDAVPLTLGQEFSGFRQMMSNCITRLESSLNRLYQLHLGSLDKNFGSLCVERIAQITAVPFTVAAESSEALGARDCMVELHGELNSIAVSTMKMANDIRFLASGPRCGFGEFKLPENEPGSSIMPGKVNPTQCESLAMICAQVMGNQAAVTIGAANGHFELNAFMPLIAANVLRSITLLSDGLEVFTSNCLDDMQINLKNIDKSLKASLMLGTVLSSHIGYDQTAKIIMAANANGTTLREEAIKAKVPQELFDEWVNPEKMLAPS